MGEAKKRKMHGPDYKSKVGLEAIRGVKTINQIAQEYGMHPVQVGQWKKEIQEQACKLVLGRRGSKPVNAESDPDRLYAKIGQLNMELEWIKKVRAEPVMKRLAWISPETQLTLSRQCPLSGVSRTSVCARRKPQITCEVELRLCRLIDEEKQKQRQRLKQKQYQRQHQNRGSAAQLHARLNAQLKLNAFWS